MMFRGSLLLPSVCGLYVYDYFLIVCSVFFNHSALNIFRLQHSTKIKMLNYNNEPLLNVVFIKNKLNRTPSLY